MRRYLTTAMALALMATGAQAGMEEAKAFLDAEIDNSTLTREEQEAEMQWFIDAAKPFAGMNINVVSETLTVHEYESKVLAEAFSMPLPVSKKAVEILGRLTATQHKGGPQRIKEDLGGYCLIRTQFQKTRRRLSGALWRGAHIDTHAARDPGRL